ncbi:asparagine synthase C-terminal domain-containing protein [Psychromonas sp. KJ10-10]|uniref:asparagine synthase C-terminal domain-containing protein n=1 Tax=Psychromonas sp. KJ10-10 TaxID=3391823 RepID=UPI0039B3F596
MVTGNVKRISSHQLPLIGPGESLRELLIASVKKRIPANNTPFGVFLSGGLDSSILAQILISLNANAIFYLLGEDGKSDDLLVAKLLVKHLDIINYRITPLPSREQFPCLIEEVVRSTESFNPSIISNGICTHLLSKAAKEDNLKIIVSGEGADELFGGYNYQNIDDDWRLFKDNLLSDMNFTELRRVDLSCMNNSIEARFPYLDKDVYSFAHGLEHKDLYSIYGTVPMNKYILRKAFENYLPKEIVWRKKTSSDVGDGIRKIVVNYLTRDNESEKIVLKRIWEKIYPHYPLDHYFHSYPCFDSVIANRSVVHKS